MSEIVKHSGVYLTMPNRTIVCHDRVPNSERYNLERLRHQTIVCNGVSPSTYWKGKDHGNEAESAELQEDINSGYEFSRIETWTTHELAAQTGTREYVVPMNGYHDSIPGRVVRLGNGNLGKVVDLNRQYEIPLSLVTDWESVLGNIAYAPARLPLQLVRDNPSIKAVVSIHEDVEHNSYPYPFVRFIPRLKNQDGFYLYDVKAYPGDPRDEIVDKQMVLLRKSLKSRGYTVYNGLDDDTDPHLGNIVKDGLVRQSIFDTNGHIHLDNTFELFVIYLQTLGLTNVERAFIVEVPGKLVKTKKRELLKMVTETFLFPVLGEMGIL